MILYINLWYEKIKRRRKIIGMKKDKNKFLKCLIINMALGIFIAGICTSLAVAQWPTYSAPFINSPFHISNVMPTYFYNNNIFPAYNISYPVVGLLQSFGSWLSAPTGYENYTNWLSDDFNKNNLFPTYEGNNSYGLYRQYYPISSYYNMIYGLPPSAFPGRVGPDSLPAPFTSQIIPIQTIPPQAPASINYLPLIMIMEWQSAYRMDEYGQKLQGYLISDRTNNLLTIQGSYYSFDEGSLMEFEYTPSTYFPLGSSRFQYTLIPGYASLIIKGKFSSGHIAIFKGTVYNNVNSLINNASSFTIKGEYEIFGLSMVEDKGTFQYPYSP